MKIIGLLGGLGPESTVNYYKEIINRYRTKTGKDEYPHIIINSVNMTRIMEMVSNKEYKELIEYLELEIIKLITAGVDFCAICSNTPHIVFNEIKDRIIKPMISIVDSTAQKAKTLRLKKVLLLGTKFTMSNNFYNKCFQEYNIDVLVPEESEQDIIHNIIFPELEEGIVIPEKKEKLIKMCNKIIDENDIDGIILGCTELPLMINENDFEIKVLDTVDIHVEDIVNRVIV
jgi:aspartate racemase